MAEAVDKDSNYDTLKRIYKHFDKHENIFKWLHEKFFLRKNATYDYI
jgi:hypothetical protein